MAYTPWSLQAIESTYGPFTINCFASINAQLPIYNSRHWDPYSSGTDALAQWDCSSHNNYANPTILRSNVVPEPLKNPRWRLYAWRLCGNPN